MERILVVGVNGMLGNALAAKASSDFDVVGTYNSFTSGRESVKLDITDAAQVNQVIEEFSPVLVVNCAAITNVDICEEQPHLAHAVHVNGTENLSKASAKYGAKFVHVSTDFVFSGNKGMYSEKDEPHPLNVYGKTKLDGEKKTHPEDLVVRTCIFGKNVENKKSMVEWIVGELSSGKEISVFNDSFFTPIYTGHLSELILDAYRKNLKGIFHISSNERVDKFTFARAVAEVYDFDTSLVKPSSISSFSRKAKRPVDTSLDCSKAASHGIRLNGFRKEIELMKHDR